MATLPQSDFMADGYKAWWSHMKGTDTYVCQARGISVLGALQSVLWSALRGPWSSYDGSHTTRPRVDGNFGPETMAALYAYAKKKGLSMAILNAVKADGLAHRISIGTMALAIWLTYYQPKIYDVDIANKRVQRIDPAEFGEVPGNRIAIPNDAKLWQWKWRPEVSQSISTVAGEKPTCTLSNDAWDFDTEALAPVPTATTASEPGQGGTGATPPESVSSSTTTNRTINNNTNRTNQPAPSSGGGGGSGVILLLLGAAGVAYFLTKGDS